MPVTKKQIAAQEAKEKKLRHRVIVHAKAGRPSRVLTKAYQRAKSDLAHLRRRYRTQPPPGPAKALAWARKQVGVTEHPPGSNRGKPVETWQRAFGAWLVGLAWCGVFVGTALKHASVKVTARVASVAAIEDDARAGRNGFEKVVPLSEARPGDVAILFGRGVHTELIDSIDHKRQVINDIGGNTSFGTGDQSNGGCVAFRHGSTARPFSDVYCVCRPAYPKS